jgi:hypothetical protein
MRFHMLRIFALPASSPEFWTEKQDRASYLRAAFSSTRTFLHRGDRFVYVFSETVNDRIITGRIGRETEHPSHTPPEEGLVPMMISEWSASTVLIDTEGGPDGQLVYVEHNVRVGLPIAMMRSLCDAINDAKPIPPWTLSINPISDESDFWHVAEHYRGAITEISFVFVPPNMFGTSDNFDEEMRRLRDEEHIDQLETSLRSKTGHLNPNTKRIKRAMEEVARGSARATIRSKRRKVYDSDSKVRKIAVDEAASNMLALVSSLFGLLEKK